MEVKPIEDQTQNKSCPLQSLTAIPILAQTFTSHRKTRNKKINKNSSNNKIHIYSAFRANPFPEVTDLSCRFPLSTLFYSTRGFSPWRPDAVMSTAECDINSYIEMRPWFFKDR